MNHNICEARLKTLRAAAQRKTFNWGYDKSFKSVACLCTCTAQHHLSCYHLRDSLNLCTHGGRFISLCGARGGNIWGDIRGLRSTLQLFLLLWQLRKQDQWLSGSEDKLTSQPSGLSHTHCSATPSHTGEAGGNMFRSTEELECRNKIPLISEAL